MKEIHTFDSAKEAEAFAAGAVRTALDTDFEINRIGGIVEINDLSQPEDEAKVVSHDRKTELLTMAIALADSQMTRDDLVEGFRNWVAKVKNVIGWPDQSLRT